MLQRIQTIYLLSAFILMGALFFIPLATFTGGLFYVKFYMYEIIQKLPEPISINFNVYILTGLAVLSILLILIAIFLFKKRLLQVKLLNISMLCSLLLIVGIFYVTDLLAEKIDQEPDYALGSIFPLISTILVFLAVRAIKRDERLVRSADRLR